MKNKIYLLQYDKNPSDDYGLLHNNIKNNHLIKDWWHHFLYMYILVSDSDMITLNNFIKFNLPGTRYLLLEIDINNFNGWLSKEAWEWLKKYKNPEKDISKLIGSNRYNNPLSTK